MNIAHFSPRKEKEAPRKKKRVEKNEQKCQRSCQGEREREIKELCRCSNFSFASWTLEDAEPT